MNGLTVLPTALIVMIGTRRISGIAMVLLIGTYLISGCTDEGGVTGDDGGSSDGAVGPPSQLAFTTEASDATAGGAITPAPQVAIRDASNNLVTSATNAVTVEFGSNPGGGTLMGTTTVNAVDGVATFNDLSVDKAESGFTLRATSGNLQSATTASFDVSSGPAATLVFAGQPTDVEVNLAMTPAVQVGVEDDFGNAASSAVTLAIGTNPGGGTLMGMTTVDAVGGVASFADLAIDKTGDGYTLVAMSGAAATATSDNFDVNPPPVGPAIQVTSDPFFQQSVAVSRNRLVWQDNRNGTNPDIFMFDALILAEAQITTTVGSHTNPDISGDRIVWRDFSTGRAEIFVHDLATGTETNASNDGIDNQFSVAIDGDRIVWREQSETTFQRDLFVFDLATSSETQVTDNSADEFPPAISGDRIVWRDERSGNKDIYMFDLATGTETQITTDPADQDSPAISGTMIVWEDARNGNQDIFMFDLATGTETQITTDPANQENPAISGNRIVWEDLRSGVVDIFMFDLVTGTEIDVTTLEGAHFGPDISDNRIVWIGIVNGNRNVFMAEVRATP